jgi:acyl-CoA synthetase (AMP-forming)/AMP-acid ligase II
MSKQPIIYKAASPAPYLPQLGLFDYLFPRAPGISPAPQFDPSLPAFIDGLDGSVLTRGELEDGALRLATGIRSLGVRRGDTVCLWGLNTPPWARTAFGLMATGVTITPANAA